MKRKLVKQGAATMMISLPAKWIKKFELKKGNEIDIEEKDNNLIIKAEKSFEKENKAEINVSGYSPLVNRMLVALYIKGIDELEVKFSNPGEIKDFQKRVINELLGFEIIKQSQKSFLIKDITRTEKQEIDEVIRRILLILDSMAQELVTAIEKKQDMVPIIEIDASINKFVNFCLRILNKKGYKEFKKTSQIYGIVSSLEEIGDLYKKIAREASKHKASKEQANIVKETIKSLNIFKNLFFNFDKKIAVEFAKKYESIKRKIKGKSIVDFYLFQLNDTIIKMNNYLLVISLP